MYNNPPELRGLKTEDIFCKNAPKPGSFWATNGQNLALSSRKWHKKNLNGENGGERKINPSANPGLHMKFELNWPSGFRGEDV